MSLSRFQIESLQERWDEAIEIAIKGGALQRCKYHEHVVLDVFGDPETTYKIANAKFTSGELQAEFASRRDLTDTIKAVIDDANLECWACAKIFDE